MSALFGRNPFTGEPAAGLTDAERLHDIEQKLRCWATCRTTRMLEHDVAWLIESLAERDAGIAKMEDTTKM